MLLEKLHLYNFRNYSEVALYPASGVQCLLGKNGSGKTNLLDAIYYLAFTKSSLLSTDQQNIRNGESAFVIRGNFHNRGRETEVVCSYQSGQKKLLMENGLECTRFADHIGKYPVVLIAPNDIELIWDSGEVRRRFFDSLISQVDRTYLEKLMIYNARLKMRNAMLRQFAERGKVDVDLLESCDHELVACGDFIGKTRSEFVIALAQTLSAHYRFIANEPGEPQAIGYKSSLQESSMADLLKKNLQRDLAMQRTTEGIHRDDFPFFLEGHELRKFGSQGQQKSFLISLKLTEFDVIARMKGFKPILLLDDIFDKLDDDRIARMLQLMARDSFGQIFITDARPDRSSELLSQAGITSGHVVVENGKLMEQDVRR